MDLGCLVYMAHSMKINLNLLGSTAKAETYAKVPTTMNSYL